MATHHTTYFYSVTPGGTNQYTVNAEIVNGEATVDAGDNQVDVNEAVPVDFDTLDGFDGVYTYVGHEPGLNGYVAQGPDDLYYLFSDNPINPGQNFNVQPEPFVVCFMPGTMIACAEGERAVETLAVGDLVRTAKGELRPIRWIGRQKVVTFFANGLQARPVHIRAGAFGDNVPARDLFVSPDHALLVDGVLAHASGLINGSSITRMADPPEQFVYYHLELDDHSLILAEGCPAETFVDNVTRRRFDNYDEYVALYGNEVRRGGEMDYPRARSARQVPSAVRARLAERAAVLGDDRAAA